MINDAVFPDVSGWDLMRRIRAVYAGDAVMASAALDRLLHRATVLNIRGDSYRMKDRHRAGEHVDVTNPASERAGPTQGQPKRSRTTSTRNGKEASA